MKVDYFIGENIKKDYFRSELIEQLTQTGEGTKSAGGSLSVYFPPKLGVCHGVVRAIRMAMHTAEKYPSRKIFLLNEMIHNPFINRELQKIGITYLDGTYKTNATGLEVLTADDVVIVPAFGGSMLVYDELSRIGCTVVDTTCGEVLSVWKRVQKYNAANFTTLVFGKYAHEETIATASRSKKYLILKDLDEIQIVADFIKFPSNMAAQKIRLYFKNACSPTFDPDVDLHQVGMASQTTMYAREFIEASNVMRQAYILRFGEEFLSDHFLELDTICSATQERQDAIRFLLPNVDIMIVVGGYNSSNTISLVRIADEQVPTYHINGTGKITRQGILFQPIGSKDEKMDVNWLPKKEHIKIGITSGASTVDAVLEHVLKEILSLDSEITTI